MKRDKIIAILDRIEMAENFDLAAMPGFNRSGMYGVTDCEAEEICQCPDMQTQKLVIDILNEFIALAKEVVGDRR